MFNLTRQEKIVLLFIASSVFAGISISYLAKHNAPFKNYFASLSRDARNSPSPVNLNKATLDELIALPGVGPELGERIIDYRNSQGSFKAIEDIQKVKGFGEKKFEQLKDTITVEETTQ